MTRWAWVRAVAAAVACAGPAAGQAPPVLSSAPPAATSPGRTSDNPREGDVLTFRTAGQPDRLVKVLRISGSGDEAIADLQDLGSGTKYSVPARVLRGLWKSSTAPSSSTAAPPASPPPPPAPSHARPGSGANGWPTAGSSVAIGRFPTTMRIPDPPPGSYSPFSRPRLFPGTKVTAERREVTATPPPPSTVVEALNTASYGPPAASEPRTLSRPATVMAAAPPARPVPQEVRPSQPIPTTARSMPPSRPVTPAPAVSSSVVATKPPPTVTPAPAAPSPAVATKPPPTVTPIPTTYSRQQPTTSVTFTAPVPTGAWAPIRPTPPAAKSSEAPVVPPTAPNPTLTSTVGHLPSPSAIAAVVAEPAKPASPPPTSSEPPLASVATRSGLAPQPMASRQRVSTTLPGLATAPGPRPSPTPLVVPTLPPPTAPRGVEVPRQESLATRPASEPVRLPRQEARPAWKEPLATRSVSEPVSRLINGPRRLRPTGHVAMLRASARSAMATLPPMALPVPSTLTPERPAPTVVAVATPPAAPAIEPKPTLPVQPASTPTPTVAMASPPTIQVPTGPIALPPAITSPSTPIVVQPEPRARTVEPTPTPVATAKKPESRPEPIVSARLPERRPEPVAVAKAPESPRPEPVVAVRTPESPRPEPSVVAKAPEVRPEPRTLPTPPAAVTNAVPPSEGWRPVWGGPPAAPSGPVAAAQAPPHTATPVRQASLAAIDPAPVRLTPGGVPTPSGDQMADEIAPHIRDLFQAVRPSVRERAATALAEGRYGSRPEVKAQIARAAEVDADPTVRAECIRLLSRLGYHESAHLDNLATWAESGPPVVRHAAQKALARLEVKTVEKD